MIDAAEISIFGAKVGLTLKDPSTADLASVGGNAPVGAVRARLEWAYKW